MNTNPIDILRFLADRRILHPEEREAVIFAIERIERLEKVRQCAEDLFAIIPEKGRWNLKFLREFREALAEVAAK